MELTYKTVRGSQQTRPEELDLTSSPDKVYLRRNITTVTEANATTGESIQLWQYEALADLYDLIASLA